MQRKVDQEHSQQIDERTRYEIDINKIRELEMEINMLRETTNHLEEQNGSDRN